MDHFKRTIIIKAYQKLQLTMTGQAHDTIHRKMDLGMDFKSFTHIYGPLQEDYQKL